MGANRLLHLEVIEGGKVFSDGNIRPSWYCTLGSHGIRRPDQIDFFLTGSLSWVYHQRFYIVICASCVRHSHTIEMGIPFILFVFGLAPLLNSIFLYLVDIIALLMIIALTVWMKFQLKKLAIGGSAKKFKHAMLMTYLAPLFLVPIFKFLLRVPLPKEGGIVNLMSLLYYTLR